MKYAIQFTGKRKGSPGIYYPILAGVEADSQALAVLALYDTYEPFEINDIYEVDQDPAAEVVECDHWVGYCYTSDGVELYRTGEPVMEDFNYCPDCGTKLENKNVEG